MKTRNILLTLALCFIAVALCSAQNVNMGTWKLNEAKSKIAPGFAKNTTVVYTMAGDSIKVTTDGVDKDGKPVHGEWTGKFDGKYYAVTGDPTTDERSYVKVDDHHLTISNKNGRQSHDYRQHRCRSRWQEPHPDLPCNRCGRQEGHQRFGVRQAVRAPFPRLSRHPTQARA